MTDTLNVETAGSADTATESQNPTSDTAQAQNPNPTTPDNQAKTFTQEELNRLIARETAKAEKAAREKIERERAEAEMSEVEKLRAEQKRLEAELATTRRASMVSSIAHKHNLPAELAERLRGETAEELEADAEQLAKFAKPVTVTQAAKVPDNGAQGAGAAKAGQIDEARREELRQRGLRI